MWGGMGLKVYHDEHDWSFNSVTNQSNDIFLEMLSDYYVEKLQDDFVKFMAKKALGNSTEKRRSSLSIDELTERKQGLGIL